MAFAPDLKGLRQKLEKGWASFPVPCTDSQDFAEALVQLGQSLGTPRGTRSRRRLVDELRPRDAHEVSVPSLSRSVGRGMQPWHMDEAHRVEPARYVVMGILECPPSTAPTELLEAHTLIPSKLQEEAISEPFLVRTGAGSFYATITARDQQFVRFDPGCMEGATERATRLMIGLVDQKLLPTHVHHWNPGSVLVIDNWKMLHRRADASKSMDRTLYRVSVMEGSSR